MTWNLKAGCKVNLFLDITGVRVSGYHEIQSLFYPLSWPYDSLHIQIQGTGLNLSCSSEVLNNNENILSRTYHLFAQKTGFAPGISLYLQKNIPMGAGLGGGSSDAAQFLSWLNTQAGTLALPKEDLADLALSLGADVPFFLYNKPAWVTGIGENIAPITCDLKAYYFLLVCPPLNINTAWAYGQWDLQQEQEKIPRKELTTKSRLIKDICFATPPLWWNCFEKIVFEKFPLLDRIKHDALDWGALTCVMSGSGPTIIALFKEYKRVMQAVQKFEQQGLLCFVSQDNRGLST